MGWDDAFWGGIFLMNTAANVSSAVTLNEMNQARVDRGKAALIRAEVIDTIDKVKRRTKKLSNYLPTNPQAVLVISNVYDRGLKLIGLTPSQLHPEDRSFLRDLYDDLDDLIEKAKANLSEEQIFQAEECVDAIEDLPSIATAIELKESINNNANISELQSGSFAPNDDELQEMNRIAEKSKTNKMVGSILLSLAGVATCFLPVMVVSEPNFGTCFASLLYLATIVVGVIFLIKSKNPFESRFKELQAQRKQAVEVIEKNKTYFDNHPSLRDYSLEELKKLYKAKDELISSILGNIGDLKKFLSFAD